MNIRRFFITTVASAVLLCPVAAHAQDEYAQPVKTSVINTQNSMANYDTDPVGARIGTDIAFTFLYDAAFAGLAAAIIIAPGSKDEYTMFARLIPTVIVCGLGVLAAPGLAVHTSHAIWGGNGNIGWGYLGGFLGLLAGGALGSITYAFDETIGSSIAGVLGFLGSITGAILGYELTNRDYYKNSASASTPVIIYPSFEISPDRNTFGVGLIF